MNISARQRGASAVKGVVVMNRRNQKEVLSDLGCLSCLYIFQHGDGYKHKCNAPVQRTRESLYQMCDVNFK